MKKLKALSLAVLIALLTVPMAQAADITDGTTWVLETNVKGVPNINYPAGENPAFCLDNNVDTKYLHFAHSAANPATWTGLRIAPAQKGKIVGGITLTSAGDEPGRDPRTYVLSGSNASIDGPYTEIASGTVTDFIQPTEWPRKTKTVTPMLFNNSVAYDYYMIIFPTLRGTDDIMQIAELELLCWSPSVLLGVDRVVRLPVSTLDLTPVLVDSDSPQLTYAWTQVSGPGTVGFGGTQNTQNATVTFPKIDGLYELKLTVTDDKNNTGSDNVIVRVWDPAVSNGLIAHWKFNEGAHLTANDSTAYNDLGTLGRYNSTAALDPNWVTGWIPADDTENFALNFRNLGYVEVVPTDPNDTKSNLLSPEWGITIAAWMNPTDWNGNRRIMQKGGDDNQYRVLAEWDEFIFHLANVGTVTGPLPKVKQWHHIAATYDGAAMKLFIDGFETASLDAMGRIGVTADNLFIGTKSKATTSPGDYFKGAMDDLRIYNYPLSPEELYEVVAAGQNAPPVVAIVQPEVLNLSISDSININATVFDVNNNTIAYKWTASDASVAFSDNAVDDPRVTFTAPGAYTLRLTVNDGMYGLDGDIYAEVTVTVTRPTCADVIADGLLLEADMNQDCSIDLLDFAIMVKSWLNCNDPMNQDCTNPYASPAVE